MYVVGKEAEAKEIGGGKPRDSTEVCKGCQSSKAEKERYVPIYESQPNGPSCTTEKKGPDICSRSSTTCHDNHHITYKC